jgi:hypothetical protein
MSIIGTVPELTAAKERFSNAKQDYQNTSNHGFITASISADVLIVQETPKKSAG